MAPHTRFLTVPQVVALSVTHMAADLALGEDRIAGDDRTLQGQSLEQRQRRRNLVRLGRHDEVADHRPELGRKGREHVQRRGVEPAAAAQRLAVKRDVPARRLAARVASERRRQGVRVESLEEVVIAGVAGRSPALDPEQPQCFRPQPATPAPDRSQIVRSRQHRSQGDPQNRPQLVLPTLPATPIRHISERIPQQPRHGQPPPRGRHQNPSPQSRHRPTPAVR